MSNTQKQHGVNMKKLIAVMLILITSSNLLFAQSATLGIDNTQRKQKSRIHQGIKSGELTKGEALSLKKQQIHIQREKKLAKTDGVVTSRERKHIRHDQKIANKNITVKKHNRFNRNRS